MPDRVTWRLAYSTETEEDNILLRHHMERFRHDRNTASMDVEASSETPLLAWMTVTFTDDALGPDTLELRHLNQLRGEDIHRALGTAQEPSISLPAFQTGLESLGALLKNLPQTLEPIADTFNSFFANFRPPPPKPAEPERKTYWQRILEENDDDPPESV